MQCSGNKMKPQPKIKKSKTLEVRVTEEIYDKIEKIALELGLTPSEFTRQAIIIYMKMLGENTERGETTRKTKQNMLFDFSKNEPEDKGG